MNSTYPITPAELVTCAIALFGKKVLLDPEKRKAALSTTREVMTAANSVNEEDTVQLAACSADLQFQADQSQIEKERKAYVSIAEFHERHTKYSRKEDALRLLEAFARHKFENQVAAKDATRSLAEQEDVYEATPEHELKARAEELLTTWKAKGINVGYIPMILKFKEAHNKAVRSKGGKNRVKRAR